MKVTVDVECTPEEARRFIGLPDLTSVHEAYLGRLRALMSDGVTADAVDGLMRSWAPFSDAGLTVWQKLLEQMTKPEDKR